MNIALRNVINYAVIAFKSCIHAALAALIAAYMLRYDKHKRYRRSTINNKHGTNKKKGLDGESRHASFSITNSIDGGITNIADVVCGCMVVWVFVDIKADV